MPQCHLSISREFHNSPAEAAPAGVAGNPPSSRHEVALLEVPPPCFRFRFSFFNRVRRTATSSACRTKAKIGFHAVTGLWIDELLILRRKFICPLALLETVLSKVMRVCTSVRCVFTCRGLSTEAYLFVFQGWRCAALVISIRCV